MVAYTKQEMVGIMELSKSLNSFIEKITSHSIEKLAIINNNKPEVVILPIQEYEKMKEAQEYLENLEILEVIQHRVLERKDNVKMVSHDEMMEFLKSKGCNV